MESQVKVNEQDTEGISNPVSCACKLGSHGSKAGRGNDDSDKASNVHASARVDLVMKPGTQGVVDQTCFEISRGNQWSGLDSILPAVVSQIALSSKGIPSFIPRLVYKRTA